MEPITTTAYEWIYERSPPGRKVYLLTIGKVAVVGDWTGEYGQTFIAWAPMHKRNRETELKLGIL